MRDGDHQDNRTPLKAKQIDPASVEPRRFLARLGLPTIDISSAWMLTKR
jgi:hypothetical protein